MSHPGRSAHSSITRRSARWRRRRSDAPGPRATATAVGGPFAFTAYCLGDDAPDVGEDVFNDRAVAALELPDAAAPTADRPTWTPRSPTSDSPTTPSGRASRRPCGPKLRMEHLSGRDWAGWSRRGSALPAASRRAAQRRDVHAHRPAQREHPPRISPARLTWASHGVRGSRRPGCPEPQRAGVKRQTPMGVEQEGDAACGSNTVERPKVSIMANVAKPCREGVEGEQRRSEDGLGHSFVRRRRRLHRAHA